MTFGSPSLCGYTGEHWPQELLAVGESVGVKLDVGAVGYFPGFDVAKEERTAVLVGAKENAGTGVGCVGPPIVRVNECHGETKQRCLGDVRGWGR